MATGNSIPVLRPAHLARGTWLEAEERAYVGGMVRRGRAVMPDGRVRAVRAGIADTYFSIPASARIDGRYVRGYVTATTASGLSTPTDTDPAYWEFRPVWKRCPSRFGGAVTLLGARVRCEGRIDPATGECSAVVDSAKHARAIAAENGDPAEGIVGRHGHSFAARYWTDAEAAE